ncbi:hypothetical protein H7F37_03055 [Winogradskyella sp. PAMC22761]|nr:hypothetical protein H7F37_03055 [Winogradskyella sp. PAMC22761]
MTEKIIPTIKVLKIFKTYPSEIKSKIPKILKDYYQANYKLDYLELYSMTYGSMFSESKKVHEFLAEFECQITKERWFGGIPYFSHSEDKELIEPEYKYLRANTTEITNTLVLVEGYESSVFMENLRYEKYERISFIFHTDNVLNELEHHLDELKIIVENNIDKVFVISNWYLNKISNMCLDGSIYKFFKDEIELIKFLKNYESRINNIIDYKKIILYFKSSKYFNHVRYFKHDYDESTYVKKYSNDYIETIENIHHEYFENNFYINYSQNLPGNTYVHNLGYSYFIAESLLKKVIFKYRLVNRFNVFEFENDDKYFSDEFMSYKKAEHSFN